MGQLVFQATAGGQVALVGPNPATNFSINVPAITGTLVTTGDTGTVTSTMLASSVYTAPGTIGSVTPNTGAFTTLSASSTVSGAGFSTYLASPPAIGGTTPSTGKFTSITNTGLTSGYVVYAGTGGLESGSANLFWDNTNGRLGIGTSSPAVSLHVLGASESAIFASTNATLNYTEYRYNTTTVNGYIGNGGILTGSGTATDFVVRSENALVFATNGATERVRIDSSGNLLVGTTNTNPITAPVNGNVFLSGGTGGMRISQTSGASYFGINGASGTQINFYTYTGGISLAGYISCPTSTTTAYTSVSDYRLKDNVEPMTGALNKVSALKPVTYTWKADGSASQGFIAHELQAVVPECVVGDKDAVDAEGKPVYQGIDTSFLVATLTAAIQEQQTLITNLTTRLTELENK